MEEDSQRGQLAAAAFLEALSANGIDYVFGNAGTDFAPLIEAYAQAEMSGSRVPIPVTVPHENLAVCMAQGYFHVTERPQVVMLHVNVGTANAICGLINAARERTPLLLAAGRTPILEAGQKGSRSAFIHWGQEMFDQAAMVREVVKWDYELRHPDQVWHAVDRALSVAMSEPRGPVYLTLPREVLASSVSPGAGAPPASPRSDPPIAAQSALERAEAILAKSRRPLLICSSLGKTAAEVEALATFAEHHSVGVVAYRTRYMALPHDHPNHLGFDVGPHLGEADLVIVAESDVPWIPNHHKPAPDARLIHIGTDPIFSSYPMRNFAATELVQGAAAATLAALCRSAVPDSAIAERERWLAERRHCYRSKLVQATPKSSEGPATNAWIATCLAGIQRPDDTFVVETPFPIAHMPFRRPGTFFMTPSAGGLGWGLGTSLGLKLGNPERRVIAVVGDGSYMFGNPTPAHMVSRTLGLPTLTIIINNGMWAAVRRATLGIYPSGAAAGRNTATPFTHLSPSPDYEHIVRASGGYGEKVERACDLPDALDRALKAVELEGRSAVLNVVAGYSDDQARRDART